LTATRAARRLAYMDSNDESDAENVTGFRSWTRFVLLNLAVVIGVAILLLIVNRTRPQGGEGPKQPLGVDPRVTAPMN
jgi:hypothetical protein